MKTLWAAILLLGLAACSMPEQKLIYEWVVERQSRPGADVQADFDTLARYGFKCEEDANLETTGFYVYFFRHMTLSEAQRVLPEVEAAMKAGRKR